MIVTVTPNPSVDRTVGIEALERGEVLRTSAQQLDPGGKGINVARALHANGHETVAVVPVGGPSGAQLLALLDGTGLEVVSVPIAGSVRSNITIAEPDGTVTKLNEPGPELSDDERARLVTATRRAAEGADWLVVCGSLPPGTPVQLLHDLAAAGRAVGARVAIDTSEEALVSALDARPDLIKPNAEELAATTGRTLATLGDAADASRLLLARGVGAVLASLGPDGALYVDADTCLHALLPVRTPRSTVGAGDSTLAGFLTASEQPIEGLRAAVAYGAAAVSLPGSQVPGPGDLHLDAVEVHTDPDRARRLAGAPRPVSSHA
jgi:1-phosphofructokinase